MALTYNGLAKAYLEEGNMGQSKIFLAKVQKMARETDFPQLKSEVYETERNFYAKNGQHNAYNASQKKLDSINDKIEAKGVAFINNSYRKMENKAISDKAVGDQQNIFIVLSNSERSAAEKIKNNLTGKSAAEVPGQSANQIILYRDTNHDGIPDLSTVFLEGLNQPYGMLIIKDRFYVANTDGVWMYPYQLGETKITKPGKKILSLPAGGCCPG